MEQDLEKFKEKDKDLGNYTGEKKGLDYLMLLDGRDIPLRHIRTIVQTAAKLYQGIDGEHKVSLYKAQVAEQAEDIEGYISNYQAANIKGIAGGVSYRG